eukprot:7193191-Karenia_brevis.AAC.1
MQTTGENTADAYSAAYDVLSHDLRRNEKLRDRGVKTKGWDFKVVDNKKVYAGNVDQVGQNFQLRHSFCVKVVPRKDGQL